MTDLDKIMGNLPKPEELAAQRAATREKHVAAVSAGLFATAADITAMMKEKGVNEGPEILLDGVLMFAAKLFDGVYQGLGRTPREAREDASLGFRRAIFAARKEAEEADKATVQ